MKKNIFFTLLLFTGFVFFAQDDDLAFCHEVSDKKAIALYKKGIDKKKYREKNERMEFLSKAIELDSQFVEAQFAMAQEMLVLWKLGKISFGPISALYKSVLRTCPDFHADPFYYIGFDHYENGRNDSAKKYLEAFIQFKSNDDKKYPLDYEQMVYNTKMMLAQLRIDIARSSKKVPFEPYAVTPVSSNEDEFLCYLSPDDSIFYFTRRGIFPDKYASFQSDQVKEKFMFSKRNSDGTWGPPEQMPPPFNQVGSEGGPTITLNSKRLYFTVFMDLGGGVSNADIYYSDLIDGEWQKPAKVPNINSPLSWDSQPTISPDGNTLFFASDRDGGIGDVDIYLSRRDPETGIFAKPVNLGPVINTKGREKCPYLHPDGETLYFSSDGRIDGYGGLDIYYSRLDEKSLTFKTPENLGSPINSEEDDAGFLVSSDGKYGYFAAEPSEKLRGRGVGRYDVYRFELYPEARPNEITFLRGTLKDAEGSSVKGGKVEIKNPQGTHKIEAVVDSVSGEYVAALNKKYFKTQAVVTAKKEGFAFSAEVVEVASATFSKPHEQVNFEMKETKVNETVVINDIHYKINSAELDSASFVMLNEFVRWLRENNSIRIEIGGHTDNVGSAANNLALSTDRAFTVKAFLEDAGIDGHRILSKGYGSTKPIADNATAQGKSQNRRTEFKILSK